MAGDAETYWKTTGVSNVPPELQDLLFRIFSPDPNNRPSIEEIIEHPWMKPQGFNYATEHKRLIDSVSECQTQKSGVTNSTDATDQEDNKNDSDSLKLPEIIPKVDPCKI